MINTDTLMMMIRQLQSASLEMGIHWQQLEYDSIYDEDILQDMRDAYERLSAEVDEIFEGIRLHIEGEENVSV